MKRLTPALTLSLAFACAKAKSVYEYGTADRTDEPRILTADGENKAKREVGNNPAPATEIPSRREIDGYCGSASSAAVSRSCRAA